MKKKIRLAEKKYCSGCASCMNICPTGAIEMRTDKEGFLYPRILEDKCISCKKCQLSCPVLKSELANDLKKSLCYAVWAVDEVRDISSSGGMFTLLAEQVLNHGGSVYGAAFDLDWNVFHKRIDNLEDLSELRGSKYVQSSIGYAYQQVKEDIENGKEVLFSGTPCQVAGLYKYLGNKREKLLTVDLLCHGVPSSKVFKKYLNEYFGNKEIADIKFRNKTKFKWSSSMHIQFADGSCYDESCGNDTFYKSFLPCLALRPSCENCSWSANTRVGDITIGDFWGIDQYNKEYDDTKGTSAVLVNTALGEKYFDNAKKRMTLVKEIPIEKLLSGNPTLLRPFPAHIGRKHFFNDIDVLPIDKLVNHALHHKYDVGIVGLWYGLNYGSILTYYALYKVVNQLGYDAIFMNKPDCLWNEKYNEPKSIAVKFIRSKCNVTGKKVSKEDWYSLNNNCDTFMVGSDVIWNYEICGKESGQFFFLDFVNNGKKKIAYASSFGSGYHAPEDVRRKTGYYLRKFDAVSVRETEAQELCMNKFGVKADKVLDAVFLCDIQEFIDIANQSKVQEKSEFIASYILGAEKSKSELIKKIASFFGIPYKVFVDPNEPQEGERLLEMDSVKSIEVEDWLYYIKNCRFFIADSFHGVCFSIIFKVPFVCYIRRDEPSKCRFINLLQLCGLEKRLIYTDEEIHNRLEEITSDIDYDEVYQKLQPYVDYSKAWLQKVLEKNKEDYYDFEEKVEEVFLNFIGEIDLLKKRLERVEVENQSLRRKILILSQEYDPYFATITDITEYLNRVIARKHDVIVAIAIRDTAGFFVDDEIYEKMRQIGFINDLRDKHWYGYVGLSGNKYIGEKLEKCGVAEYQDIIKNKNIQLISKSYMNGDIAQIIIDGVDYAINKRGLNIVLLSKRDLKVIDSVCFDTHTREKICYRQE